ncbi:chaperonin 10-like protein [Achaetomium macrosporum]|uniref:Chaperonin 10-like protein n=1 Tax=Achaetomium macrosporum TaxID=79813 RepID=A0AAN7C4Z6_9PEZI|nr:chaperonin 10-like protein [Achaetomium macrosporum]
MSQSATNLAALLPGVGKTLVLEERAIPSPGPDEILIRNRAIALNPIDWKRQAFGIAVPSDRAIILGSDVAGEVVSVGSNIPSSLFTPGDRVLGSADGMMSGNPDHAAFQRYTIVSATSASKLPDTLSFPEAATLPTAFGTAVIALFHDLGLPLPTGPSTSKQNEKKGILVWGGATAVGSAAIQLARLAGLTVYATASPTHHARVRALGAAEAVDYRSAGPTSAADEILAAAGKTGVEIGYVLVAAGDKEVFAAVKQVLESSPRAGDGGKIKKVASLLPWPEEEVAKPEGAEVSWVRGMEMWRGRRDLSAWLNHQNLKGWLEKGEVEPHKVRVVQGGIGGLQAALDELKKGVSGEKLVVEP